MTEQAFNKADNPQRIAFIGGAASTIITLAYLVRDIKSGLASPAELVIFDKHGLNEGPAYRHRNPGFILNQPCGEDMNPFAEGGDGLPRSFINWLNSDQNRQKTEKAYHAGDFVSRGLYGDYLLYVKDWVQQEIQGRNDVTLRVVNANIAHVAKQQGQKTDAYTLTTEWGTTETAHGLVLATGHTYSPKIKHERYLPVYAGTDFGNQLQSLSQTTDTKTIIGSGASMADVVCAFEQLGHQGNYAVISPYGNTRWPYNPLAVKPADERIQGYVEAFLDSRDRRPTSEKLRSIVTTIQNAGFGPQYILAALLNNDQVKQDADLLKVTKAFYGNPLSPERFEKLAQLEKEGRLTTITDRVAEITPSADNKLVLRLETKSEQTAQHVIDCSVVNRGLTDTPRYLRDMIGAGVVQTTHNGQALPNSASDNGKIFAVGPITNAFKNGIGSFRDGYRDVAENVAKILRRPQPGFSPAAPQVPVVV